MNFDHKHSFSPEEALERLRALGDYLTNRHGIAINWRDDSNATFKGKYLVVKIEGDFKLEDDMIRVRGKDPGMLWRKKATKYLKEKLEKYLDPSTPVDALDRHA